MRLVLDTNIVLDWLVFSDPSTISLRDAVREKQIEVLTHAPAVDELRRVLGYPKLKLDVARQIEVLTEYRGLALLEHLPEQCSLPSGFPRCRDRDDEHFLALAYHAKTDALVSRDKAVLKLKSKAEKFGVQILNVQQMNAMFDANICIRSD